VPDNETEVEPSESIPVIIALTLPALSFTVTPADVRTALPRVKEAAVAVSDQVLALEYVPDKET